MKKHPFLLLLFGAILIFIFIQGELLGAHDFRTGLALGAGVILVASWYEEYKKEGMKR
ncbi:MAG: hypothetical protein Q8M92_04070 [Candidatus Subteraquimicrobiales bacterium]|nr:hypothetical protein [Candidatus Subteraquimicrobiales bacterium]